MSCDIQASGTIELLFYGELTIDERAPVQAHLAECADCRQALEDLSVIRTALAMRPDVATPAGGDWSAFMARLNDAIEKDAAAAAAPHPPARVLTMGLRRRFMPYAAMAAALALVTFSVSLVTRDRREPAVMPLVEEVTPDAPVARAGVPPRVDPALVALSGEHFERSKLVVLGLATKDASHPDEGDWAYERDLATTLLSDTRLYRLAAEERGMKSLAEVMRDLELVLLQTSMAEGPDDASLEQLQRLIQRRNLLTKMNVVHAAQGRQAAR